MASERQINANRGNAKKSTGPKTPAGKAVSRWNALMHGLTATSVPVLPGERADDLDDLRLSLLEHVSPVGPVEEELVDHLTLQLWRLARVYRVETGILAWYLQTGYEQANRDDQRRSFIANAAREGNHADRPPPKLVVEPDDEEVVLEEWSTRGMRLWLALEERS